MKKFAKKWITFTVRWGIAVAGIWYVLANTPFHDQLLLVGPDQSLLRAQVLDQPAENARQFTIIDPARAASRKIDRDDVWTRPDNSYVNIWSGDKILKVKLLALRPGPNYVAGAAPAELLVQPPAPGPAPSGSLARLWAFIHPRHADHNLRVSPTIVPGGYTVRVPYPLIDIGVARLVREAKLGFLLAALAVLPFSYLITSRRWHMLLEAMDIHLSQARTFVLNMVGCFYNAFMPGSTGGDLIKAYYASKHTPHRVRAVLSVIVDRVVGLLALIVLGGVMAASQWHVKECRRVAITCLVLTAMTAVGLVLFYHPVWRKKSGLQWLMMRLPMQKQVHNAIEAMELYGQRPGAAIWGGIMTFPVHLTTILSALFAGAAFGITMHPLYYFTVVPVLVLVSAIPLAPQGAGVMEVFAVQLTKNQGVTVSQAIALAMAVRFGQMFWNLVAGLFVLRGGYHVPSETEQQDLESDAGPNADGPGAPDGPMPDPAAG